MFFERCVEMKGLHALEITGVEKASLGTDENDDRDFEGAAGDRCNQFGDAFG